MTAPPDPPRALRAAGPLFYVGSAALFLAMAIDALAVLMRHVGATLLGSIELVQAAILVAASCAVVVATRLGAHARVHLLTNRLGARSRNAVAALSRTLSVLFFLLLAAGQAWVAHDLWHGQEESELLHIPYAPLRIIGIASLVAAGGITALRLGARRRA